MANNTNGSPPRTVAIYARVSTEEQRAGQTILSQIDELQRHASLKGWTVTDVYKDEGWSGSLLARPELDRLRDDAPRGLFQAVLLNDVDRLARDVTHLGIFKRDLERHGVRIIFRKLPDENTPTRNLLVNILGSFAEFERELISDRTRRGRRHKVEVRQQFLGCRPAYGYSYIRKDHASKSEGHLQIRREEAVVVQRMYRWVAAEGLSARRVVDRLNRLRIPTRGANGHPWQSSTVLRILRSSTYVGTWHYNKNESLETRRPAPGRGYARAAKTGRRLRPRTEWLPVELPEHLRIVRRDVWERVQRQLDRNIAFSPRNAKHKYLLQGLLKCGGCSRRYTGDPNHGCFYYRCSARCRRLPTVPERVLDDVVWAAIVDTLLDPKILRQGVTRLEARKAREAATRDETRQETAAALKDLQVEESRLLDAYRLGALPPALLGRELQRLNDRRAALQSASSSESAPTTHRATISSGKPLSPPVAQEVAERLQSLTIDERRALLRAIVTEVVFGGTDVRIKGRLERPSSPTLLPRNRPLPDPEPEKPRDVGPVSLMDWIAPMLIEHCGRNPAVEFEVTARIGFTKPPQSRDQKTGQFVVSRSRSQTNPF